MGVAVYFLFIPGRNLTLKFLGINKQEELQINSLTGSSKIYSLIMSGDLFISGLLMIMKLKWPSFRLVLGYFFVSDFDLASFYRDCFWSASLFFKGHIHKGHFQLSLETLISRHDTCGSIIKIPTCHITQNGPFINRLSSKHRLPLFFLKNG